MPWSRVVWFRKSIPRHSFLLWMSIQGGLCTQDSLMRLSISTCSRCILCGCSSEDIDHLFFKCFFSSRVWSSVLAMCGLHWRRRDWRQTVEWWLVADLDWVLFLQNQYSKFLGFEKNACGFAWFPTQVSFLSFGIKA